MALLPLAVHVGDTRSRLLELGHLEEAPASLLDHQQGVRAHGLHGRTLAPDKEPGRVLLACRSPCTAARRRQLAAGIGQSLGKQLDSHGRHRGRADQRAERGLVGHSHADELLSLQAHHGGRRVECRDGRVVEIELQAYRAPLPQQPCRGTRPRRSARCRNRQSARGWEWSRWSTCFSWEGVMDGLAGVLINAWSQLMRSHLPSPRAPTRFIGPCTRSGL